MRRVGLASTCTYTNDTNEFFLFEVTKERRKKINKKKKKDNEKKIKKKNNDTLSYKMEWSETWRDEFYDK